MPPLRSTVAERIVSTIIGPTGPYRQGSSHAAEQWCCHLLVTPIMWTRAFSRMTSWWDCARCSAQPSCAQRLLAGALDEDSVAHRVSEQRHRLVTEVLSKLVEIVGQAIKVLRLDRRPPHTDREGLFLKALAASVQSAEPEPST